MLAQTKFTPPVVSAEMDAPVAAPPLVVLAEALDITEIFTGDRRGFLKYRPPRGERFQLLPEL